MAQAIPLIVMALPPLIEGITQNSAARGAANVDNENARLTELQGAYNEDDLRRRGRATQGEAIAALAEGGPVDGGSAQDLIYQNALEIEYQALGARYGAAQEARGYRFKAQQEKQAGRNALIGGIMRAGAAAVTGATNARNQGATDAAQQRYYEAYFPGGQRLPMPPPPSAGRY